MPRIAPATHADYAAVQTMVEASLAESYAKGAETVPSPQSVAVYMRLFDAYLDEQLAGVALVALENDQVVGTLLAGEAPMSMGVEMNWGPLANWWVGFVDPTHRKKGIASHLLHNALSRLRTLGFKTVLAGTYVWNESMIATIEKAGFDKFQVAHTYDLQRSR